MRGISGLDAPNTLTIAGEKKIYQQLFRGANTRNRTGDILAANERVDAAPLLPCNTCRDSRDRHRLLLGGAKRTVPRVGAWPSSVPAHHFPANAIHRINWVIYHLHGHCYSNCRRRGLEPPRSGAYICNRFGRTLDSRRIVVFRTVLAAPCVCDPRQRLSNVFVAGIGSCGAVCLARPTDWQEGSRRVPSARHGPNLCQLAE